MSEPMAALDSLSLKFSFTSRTPKFLTCSNNNREFITKNVIETSLYWSMNHEGQEGDHNTKSSSAQVESEVLAALWVYVDCVGKKW